MKFIELLDSFNRKERYHLLNNALKDPFQLSARYRLNLSNVIDVDVPENAWVAIDYHVDWLAVSRELFRTQRDPTNSEELDSPINELFEANQRDIDLVVAFEDRNETTHRVLGEAKPMGQIGR